MIKIKAFDKSINRKTFHCTSEPLNHYFQKTVSQDVKRKLSSCFVAENEQGEIVSFYTLAATGICLDLLPESEAKKLPKYPLIPCVLLGRLAVDERFTGQGLGRVLLVDAIQRVSRSDIAAFAVMVEAKDESAKLFYEKMGFQALIDEPLRLFFKLRFSGCLLLVQAT